MIYVVELKDLQSKISMLIPTILANSFKETDDYYIGNFEIIYKLGISMGMIPMEIKYKYLQINK